MRGWKYIGSRYAMLIIFVIIWENGVFVFHCFICERKNKPGLNNTHYWGLNELIPAVRGMYTRMQLMVCLCWVQSSGSLKVHVELDFQNSNFGRDWGTDLLTTLSKIALGQWRLCCTESKVSGAESYPTIWCMESKAKHSGILNSV